MTRLPAQTGTQRLCLRLAFAFLLGLPLLATAAPADFPRPPGIESRVDFWRRIFTQYSEYQVVLHDAEYPAKIIRVLDFRPLKASGASAYELENTMRLRERREKIAIDNLFARLQRAGSNPQTLSAEEMRVWKLYADLKRPNKFLAARGRIRGQRGLREKFAQAIVISGRYLPHMERIFQQAGLPVELTRLPFVESSFNLNAYSKVGAAGIWQFIPSSARLYMRLDDVVDDRRDPLFSTEAAAAHLRDDYNALQAWPLAVTAYNHGRMGVIRGIKQTGSRNIVEIIRRYNSRNFGFASKNFYASFLAAVDVQRDYLKYFGPLPIERPLSYQYVRIHDYMPYATLQRLSGLGPDSFRIMNPAYHQQVVEGRLRVPPLHRIRVPMGRAQLFAAAYARLSPNERFSSQRFYYSQHRVRPGQSLGGIARLYGVSIQAVREANGLTQVSHIRVGQMLKIPPRSARAATNPARGTAVPEPAPAMAGQQAVPVQPVVPAKPAVQSQPVRPAPAPAAGGPPVAAATPAPAPSVSQVPPAAPPAQKPVVRHTIVSGDTIDRIARRYGASKSDIMSANNISNPRRLKLGQVLVIPRD